MKSFARQFGVERGAAAVGRVTFRLRLVLGTMTLLVFAAWFNGPSLLRSAGWLLVVDDPPTAADVIVVSVATDGAGVLEAADLVHAGIAPRVAVFADPPDRVDEEFLRRGIPYEDAGARAVRQATALGVPSVSVIPRRVSGSEEETGVLASWCEQHGFTAVIVVSLPDHSRRLKRMLRRAFAGSPILISVRSARYAPFDPDRWWESRDGLRIGIVELEKLLLDGLRHPFS